MVFGLRRRRDAHLVGCQLDLAAESSQDLRHQRDVEDVGTVRNGRGALGKQRGCHQLENTVLGTADDNVTNEPISSGDKKAFTHNDTA